MCERLGSRVWMAALTGVPFAIYKAGFGWYEYHQDHPVIGIAAICWGLIDFVMNLLAVWRPQSFSWCLLAHLGRWIDRRRDPQLWEKVLLAVDTTAAFAIVSIMIWFARLPLSPEWAAIIWNLAVIANIMSVGLAQLFRATYTGTPLTANRHLDSKNQVVE